MHLTAHKAAVFATALAALWTADVRAQSGGGDLPDGFRTLAGVTLDRDSAATIRAKLGDTRERRVGSGHDAFVSWCYVQTARPPGALLELMSDASDMGTPGHELNVIQLRADASAADREGCAPLREPVQLSTPAGLRLGLNIAAVEKLLGPPTRRNADSLTYYFDAKEYLTPNTPEYEVWNTLEERESCFDAGPPYANVEAAVTVVFRHGEATEIRVERFDKAVC